MKMRYQLPLFVAGAVVMILVQGLFVSQMVTWSLQFLRDEYGCFWNIAIIKGFACVASLVVGSMALPLALITKGRNYLGGGVLAVLGISALYNPVNGDGATHLLIDNRLELAVYTVSCLVFWLLGARRARRGTLVSC